MSLTLRRLSTADSGFEADFQRVLHWSADTDAAIEQRVAAILEDVRTRGDAAVLETTARFDGLQAASVAALEIGQDELRAALSRITPDQRRALQAAADRVRRYHERQLEACGRSWSYRDEDDTLLGQKVTPLDRVGLYVPGGKAAYPSSVLMNAVPARVAGVGEIIMVVPTPVRGSVATGGAGAPSESGATTAAVGERNDLVLAAAAVAGVDRAFTIGGAQCVGLSRGDARQRRSKLAGAQLERGHRGRLQSIEARGVLEHRRVAAAAHVGHDLGHARLDGRVGLGRPVQHAREGGLEVRLPGVQARDAHRGGGAVPAHEALPLTAASSASTSARIGSRLSLSAAWLTTRRADTSRICSTSTSWLARSVPPVDTRSTIASARPVSGASSIEP